MKHLSRLDIEGISLRIIEAYKKLPEIAGQTFYRIDPVLLCESLLHLNIDYMHLSLDGSILGMTSFEELGVEIFEDDDADAFYILDGKTVLVESELKKDITMRGRCNFTIAHEASHQIFKMLFPQDYGANRNVPAVHFYRTHSEKRKPISDWEEWQANTLAAAILIPQELIGQALYLFGLPERIEVLNRHIAPAIYDKFVAMADFMGCSKTALAIRLKQLGILKKDYLDRPCGWIDVEVY